MSVETDYFSGLYHNNLERIWDSLLPAPDIRIIKTNGDIEKIDQTILSIASHYLFNIAQLAVSLATLPFTFALCSLIGRVTVAQPSHQVEHYTPEAFGFANSGLQDGAVGTDLDPSELNGHGIGDWNKIFHRAIQKVTENGKKIGEITHGITLKEGDRIEDLFVNIIDYPEAFADLLKELGCSAYRISLERSVIEPEPGKFNNFAIQKYKTFFEALQKKGIEPWVTLHHFTNPQWFEDRGGFTEGKNIEENIAGFVRYCETMVDEFPMIRNWMTFNEPGIRGLEGYVRGEHPPQQKHVPAAARVIRNLLIAHTKAYTAMKAKKGDLRVGITHQWIKFLPFSWWNLIGKITGSFFTSLTHTPIYNFFKDGVMHVKLPFRANVQLRYESEIPGIFADFLGVQAYGYARVHVGFNRGVPYPGAADKVHNIVFPRLGFGFTAGSTCEEGGSMQYFGPPCKPTDLIDVLEEAFSIPKERIPSIGITETGSDAKRMDFGETNIKVDNEAQARAIQDIYAITQKYPLDSLFLWTLNRHCEWLSGGMPNLGITKLKNEPNGAFSYEKTAGWVKVQEIFHAMQENLASQDVA